MPALERVADAELFRNLSTEQCRRVTALATLRTVHAGARVFEIGDEAHEIFLVCRGQIELTFPLVVMGKPRDIRFQVLAPGSTLAWSALVPPHRLTMSARAAVETELWTLPRRQLLDLFGSEPAIGYAVISQLAHVIAARLQEFQTLWVKEMQRNVTQTYR